MYVLRVVGSADSLSYCNYLIRQAKSFPCRARKRFPIVSFDHYIWNDKTQRLTPKEYGLLEFMLRNKNRVLSRLTLAEHVWGDNFDVMTNFIDVHIKNLRRKMDAPFSPRLIHTVRGVGYVLRDPENDDDAAA